MAIGKGHQDRRLGWIPAGWSVKSGAEITSKITKGASPKWQGFDYHSEGVLFITSENVQHGRLDVPNPKFVSSAFHAKLRNSQLRRGDILINIVGASIGRACLYSGQHSSANINQAVGLFRPTDSVDPVYILNYLLFPRTVSRLIGTQSETARPNLTLGGLGRFRFVLPPLPEQRVIAEILGTWDEAIALTERRIAAARQRKKGLMQRLLTGKRRVREFAGQAWREVRLGDLGETYSGLRGKSKDDFGEGKAYIPYLNIYNNWVIDPEQMDYVLVENGERQSRVKYGDIFFTTSSETPHEVGMSSVLLDDVREAYLNSFCYGFRLKEFTSLLPEYAAHLLRGEDFRHAMHYLAQGATRYNLTKRYLLEAPLRLPPLAEQRRIAKVLSACDEEIDLLNCKLAALQTQKKGLMQRLLTGRVRVSPDG